MFSCQITAFWLLLLSCVSGYGFTSGQIGTKAVPGRVGSIAVGDTVNLTWETGGFEKNIDLVLDPFFSTAELLRIATNINNTGSFSWKVPQNISNVYLGPECVIELVNHETKELIFSSGSFYIKSNPSPTSYLPKGRFTWPTGEPSAVYAGDYWNVTWDFPAAFVNLSVSGPGDDPDPIFGKSGSEQILPLRTIHALITLINIA